MNLYLYIHIATPESRTVSPSGSEGLAISGMYISIDNMITNISYIPE